MYLYFFRYQEAMENLDENDEETTNVLSEIKYLSEITFTVLNFFYPILKQYSFCT